MKENVGGTGIIFFAYLTPGGARRVLRPRIGLIIYILE